MDIVYVSALHEICNIMSVRGGVKAMCNTCDTRGAAKRINTSNMEGCFCVKAAQVSLQRFCFLVVDVLKGVL